MNEIPSDRLPPLPLERPAALPEPPANLARLLLGLALSVAVFDFCFWKVNAFGFSVAVFVIAFAVILLTNREKWWLRRSSVLIFALLAGSAAAAAIETGTTNALSLLILIIILAGNSWFSAEEPPWGRWNSQIIACLLAPGRIFWLGARLLEAATGKGIGWTGSVGGGCLLTIPAFVLAVIFGSLLAAGNSVFGNWTGRSFDWLTEELLACLNPVRILFWLVVAFAALPFLRPAFVSPVWYRWTQNIPRFPEIIPNQAAFFSNVLTLVVLNLVFLVANYADALFLWSGAALPAGVNYKSYVHEGVNALIITVLLTAVVLTTIFQQSEKVSGKPLLKGLALFWIAQNVFLMASVALRIKHYIEGYEMTVARLGVLIFLVLVATGFVLLTIKIIKAKSLAWLAGGCLVAVFLTFYTTQFLNLSGWSADYNIAAWEKDRTRQLDFWHLYEYGPAAWPALRHAHEVDPSIAVLNTYSSNGFPVTTDTGHWAELDSKHWREFSLRAYWNSWALDDKK